MPRRDIASAADQDSGKGAPYFFGSGAISGRCRESSGTGPARLAGPPPNCTIAARTARVDRRLENQENGRMKTTLDLPDELVKQVKLRALREGRKLKDA